MTPDERARADAIIAALGKKPSRNNQEPIPGITQNPQSSRIFIYITFFVLAVSVNVAGWLIYRHVQDQAEIERREEESRKLTEASIAATSAAKAQLEALRKTLAAQPQPSYAPIIPAAPVQTTRVVPAPTPRPQPVQIIREQQPEPAPQPQRDRARDHSAVAVSYMATKRGIGIRVTDVSPVPGWEGRYRTTGESVYNFQKSPSPKIYEILTQEKDGQISAIDVVTKWK